MTSASSSRSDDDPITTDLVEYLIVAVPAVSGMAMVVPALADLVGAGLIRILDLVVLERHRDGAVEVLELEAVDSIAGLRDVEGDVGGLLSDGDIELASLAIQPGTAGIVLVINDRWAQPLSATAHRAGGQIIAGERIPAPRVEAVLADHS